tara:strand:- start:222 stop:512 length:291 start_codon:yes stop_codon:yes gene_type:complete
MFLEICRVLTTFLTLYSTLLIIRVLLTWFPGMDWSNPILSALTSITDPYLNIFRGIIPPIGGFDISSILAFLVLNVFQTLIVNLSNISSYASFSYG